MKRRVPITKDQATIEVNEEGRKSVEEIEKAQKEVGNYYGWSLVLDQTSCMQCREWDQASLETPKRSER